MPRKTDPAKARKQWEIAAAVIRAGPDAAVVYADESRVQTLPLLRAMWQWVGQQIRVPTPGSNTTRGLRRAEHPHGRVALSRAAADEKGGFHRVLGVPPDGLPQAGNHPDCGQL